MSLAIDYCRELSSELKQIPVYMPGEDVEAGDIISFGRGSVFGPAKPMGTFSHISNLRNMGIEIKQKTDPHPQPFIFSSKGGVNMNFSANVDVATKGSGKLSVSFSKEGATYFFAANCAETRLDDISKLKQQLMPYSEKMNWRELYIVTSVVVSEKALIMQSSSKTGSLEISGDVDVLKSGAGNIAASAKLAVNGYKDAAFIKDWSDSVQVFMKLVNFRKPFLGDWHVESHVKAFRARAAADNNLSAKAKKSGKQKTATNDYELVKVSYKDLL